MCDRSDVLSGPGGRMCDRSDVLSGPGGRMCDRSDVLSGPGGPGGRPGRTSSRSTILRGN